jgi:uncharacterized membrane protein
VTTPAALTEGARPAGDIVDRVRATLRTLFASKKFLAVAAAGLILLAGWAARAAGVDVDQGALDRVLIALLTYVGAQGFADIGKGATQARGVASLPSISGALEELVTSKKFLASVAAALVALVDPLARSLGITVDSAALDRLFLALLAYTGAQGVADFGKGAAQVSATVRKVEPTPPPT